MVYTAKVITIANYSIVAAETWEQALDISNVVAPTAIRKWYMKARENDEIDTAFDYNFSGTSPTTWATNGGQGVAFDGVSLPNIYVRARNAANVIEIVYFS
jgi:hypothetical protein